jgi:hypothetical protein
MLGQKEKQFTAKFDPLLHTTPYHWALACKGLFQHAGFFYGIELRRAAV